MEVKTVWALYFKIVSFTQDLAEVHNINVLLTLQ